MLRRILSGSVSGLAIGAVIVVISAQFAPETSLKPKAPAPGEAEVPAGSEFNAELPDTAPVLPDTDGRPAATDTPMVDQPGTAEAPALDTDPADTPDAGAAEAELASPESGASPEVSGAGETGVTSTGDAPVPSGPLVDRTPEQAEALERPAADAVSPAPLAPAVEDAPDVAVETADTPAALTEGAEPSAPIAELDPASEDSADRPETSSAETVVVAPEPEAPSVFAPDTPLAIGVAQPEISGISPGDVADNLPRIGAQPEPTTAGEFEPALTKYSSAFNVEGEAPLLSLVLIDNPGAVDPTALANFPVPLTIAVDPIAEGAGARMAAWRAAGAEVVVLTPLAAGAAPADVEVSFQSFLDSVPQAVAVMDLPAALLQENRPRAAQVVEILAATGHGMVTYDRGLNSGLQIAQGRGVHAASVFRTFDDGSRGAGAMKRFLDQGAFRAGQAGNVVMVGQLRDETIAAIAEWVLGTRAASVNLSPLSAVLLTK